MMTFVTLFDSYYLDKGIVLYNSLVRNAKESFKLFIFCFDDKTYDILEELDLKCAILLRSSVLENELMIRLKKQRSKAEYCWTCTPQVIEYVLNNFDVQSVTYIDSDLYFFDNPQTLFDEIEKTDANIVITEHRFDDNYFGRRMLKRSGKYCVEFNYFDQSENSRECLKWWKDKCLEWCYHIYEPERMGDQKYLEKFPILFKGVHELQNLGGGVAPWNLAQYALERQNDCGQIFLKDRKSGEKFKLIFYHFQNIRYIGNHHANICSGTTDKKLKYSIYKVYLSEIESVREMLKGYDVFFSTKKKYSSNKLIAFGQATFLRFKIKSLSDVINLDKLRTEAKKIGYKDTSE